MGIFWPRAVLCQRLLLCQGYRVEHTNGVHGIDSTDTSRNHLLGVDSRVGVNGRAVDIEVVFGEHLRALVDGSSRTVKDATQHVLRYGDLEILSRELDGGLADIDSGGAFKDL